MTCYKCVSEAQDCADKTACEVRRYDWRAHKCDVCYVSAASEGLPPEVIDVETDYHFGYAMCAHCRSEAHARWNRNT
jgi:hypothetical protein